LFDPNHGLMIADNGNPNLTPCVINAFTKRNLGREQMTVDPVGPTVEVDALTALRAWVQFAVRIPNGPLDSNEVAGGVPVADLTAGRSLFGQQCASCHSGPQWTTSIKNFPSPPANTDIACEVDLAAAAPPGSFCTTAPATGDPVNIQYLNRFLRNVGSYNLGVPGQGNPLGNNIGGEEKAAATLALVNGIPTSQPQKDALGIDFNGDGRGNGFNVQSLLGVNLAQPYMHNGACESIACVVNDVKHRTANGTRPDVLNTAIKRRQVTRYVESIDAATSPF
jgi:hypothetical protein